MNAPLDAGSAVAAAVEAAAQEWRGRYRLNPREQILPPWLATRLEEEWATWRPDPHRVMRLDTTLPEPVVLEASVMQDAIKAAAEADARHLRLVVDAGCEVCGGSAAVIYEFEAITEFACLTARRVRCADHLMGDTSVCASCGATIGHRYRCPVFHAAREADRERRAKQEAYDEIDRLRGALDGRWGEAT